jgi:hypothetical protein
LVIANATREHLNCKKMLLKQGTRAALEQKGSRFRASVSSDQANSFFKCTFVMELSDPPAWVALMTGRGENFALISSRKHDHGPNFF